MSDKTNNIIAKAFIILSLSIPFINLDIVFGEKYLNKSLLYTNGLLDSALWPKFLALTLMLLLFTLVLLFISKKESYKTNLFNQKIFIVFSIFILANFVSIFYAQFAPQAIIISIKNLLFLIYFSLGILFISKLQNSYIFISKSFVVFGLFASVLGLFQLSNSIVDKELSDKFMLFVNATFANKNLFSQILLLSLPFAIYTAIRNKNSWRWISIFTAIIELILIVLIYSRAVLLGLFISSLLTILITIYFRKKININFHQIKVLSISYILFLSIILSALFIYTKYFIINPQHDTISINKDINSGSTKERLMLWEASLKMISENPILGVGAGNWDINLRKYTPLEIRNSGDSLYWNFKRAHNDYLQTAAEIGLVGILSFIGIFLIIILYAIIIIKNSNIKAEKHFAILMLFSINSYLIISLFSFPKERISHWIILLLIFISISILKSKNNKDNRIVSSKLLQMASVFTIPIIIFAIAISVYSINGEIHTRKAFHYRNLNKHKEVIKEIELANSYFYQIDLSVIPIKWYSATAYFQLNNINKAQLNYAEAYNIHPYLIHNINDLATTYELQGNHNMSIHLYKEAIDISPKFDEALLNLSIVYYNLNEIDSAFYYLNKCNAKNNSPKYKLATELILKKLK